jgi:hypothetical protein
VLSHAIEDQQIQKVHGAQNQQYHTDFFADNLNGLTAIADGKGCMNTVEQESTQQRPMYVVLACLLSIPDSAGIVLDGIQEDS